MQGKSRHGSCPLWASSGTESWGTHSCDWAIKWAVVSFTETVHGGRAGLEKMGQVSPVFNGLSSGECYVQ